MAAGIGYWLVAVPFGVVLGVIILAVIVVAAAAFIKVCTARVSLWWGSPRMRLLRLGGVTTLRRSLGYPCVMCRDSMEAGEKVRTLSCGHVFHRGGTAKCPLGIDAWLVSGNAMSILRCPVCNQVPHPVPWRLAPSYSAQTPDSEEEEEFLFPSHWFDETPPDLRRRHRSRHA